MNYLGITYSLKNQPLLDKDFIPFGIWIKAYLQDAARPFQNRSRTRKRSDLRV